MRKPQSDVPATPVIQVIERMFSLIDVLASREEAISLKEISEKTGLHPSTTHRILNDLAVGRFVDRPEAGSYRLGMRLLELGNLVKGPKHDTIADWTARQAYIALGQLMTSAATLGVDTTPMEGLDPAAFDKLLGLDGSGYATVVACAVGHRAADDAYAALPKVRFATDELVVNL